MNKQKKVNSKFLKKISDKIANLETAYDIDEENININNINQLDINNESQENIPVINTNNTPLKESIISSNQIQPSLPHNLSPINFVYCRNHDRAFLKFDQNTFEIVCEKCLEEGNKSQLEINNIINNNNTSQSLGDTYDTEFNCYVHNDTKGSFYCDECKEFICKMCFAEEHRQHKCHLPEVIKKEFIEQIDESINSSSELAPVFNENIIDIKNIYENMKRQKDDIEKIPQNVIKIIFNNNETQMNLMNEKINSKMLGIDKEINDNFVNFNIIKDKSKKYIELLEKILNEINNNKFENNFELCKYHKNKADLLNEISKYINTSLNFINIRLKNSNEKFEEKKNIIENSMNMISKEI